MEQHKRTLAGRLRRANRLIINASKNPEILALVVRYGYSDAELAVGRKLHDAAAKAMELQAAKAGAQQYATQQAHIAERAARAAHQNLVLAVRALFAAGTPERTALNINGRVPTATADFVATATTLFNNALNLTDIGAKLARRGYDPAAIARGREALLTYQELLQVQAKAKSGALHATTAQKSAFAELDRWTAEFAKFAKIALRKRPDLMRELGIAPQRKTSKAPQAATQPQTDQPQAAQSPAIP